MGQVNGRVSIGYLHPGDWSAAFGTSLMDLMMWDATHNGRVMHRFGHIALQTGAAGIAKGRSKIADQMVSHSDAEWLWYIDADMGFMPDTLDRLVDSADPDRRPIMGGLAFAQKQDGTGLAGLNARRYRCQPTIYTMYEDDGKVGFVPRFDYERDTVQQTDATGAACLLVHRRAIEKMQERFGFGIFDHIVLPKGPEDEGGRTEFFEDLSFCLRAQACDIPIHVDTSIKTTHDKGGVYLDEETFDIQQALFAVAS